MSSSSSDGEKEREDGGVGEKREKFGGVLTALQGRHHAKHSLRMLTAGDPLEGDRNKGKNRQF